jgi:2-methylisocitrate lyase-like PEP mutase family enzyme
MVVAPACYDALGALIAQRVGFEAVYLSGNLLSAATLGQRDVGVLTMTEVVAAARRIAAAVSIPVFADADTGYGGDDNVARTVREFEAAGVQAIHIEDQVFPKVCPALAVPEVLPREDAARRIETAARARSKDGLVIVARTDALLRHGLEEAVTRANLFAAAGADLCYVEGIADVRQMEVISREVRHPLCLHLAENRSWSDMTLEEVGRYGFRLVFFGLSTGLFIAGAVHRFLTELRARGSLSSLRGEMMDRDTYHGFLNAGYGGGDAGPGAGSAGPGGER